MTALDALSWREAGHAAAGGHLLAVPVGSTEQHGPHLPLTTDAEVAAALARMLADHRGDVVVAPTVPYGSSGEHEGFAGTLSIGQHATELLLVELGRSASQTFTRIVLVSTHGGNAVALARAVERLREEGRAVLPWSPRWAGDAHAGRTETSLMLHLAPERVRQDQARRGNPRPVAQLMPAMRRGGVRAVSQSGVLGDPAGASAAEGEALLRAAADDLCDAVAGWLEGQPA